MTDNILQINLDHVAGAMRMDLGNCAARLTSEALHNADIDRVDGLLLAEEVAALAQFICLALPAQDIRNRDRFGSFAKQGAEYVHQFRQKLDVSLRQLANSLPIPPLPPPPTPLQKGGKPGRVVFNLRGERNVQHKLTAEQVRAIRKYSRDNDPLTTDQIRELATMYEVTATAIYSILAGRTWAWLDAEKSL